MKCGCKVKTLIFCYVLLIKAIDALQKLKTLGNFFVSLCLCVFVSLRLCVFVFVFTLTYPDVIMVFPDIFCSSHNVLIIFREVLVNLRVKIVGQIQQKCCLKCLSLKE